MNIELYIELLEKEVLTLRAKQKPLPESVLTGRPPMNPNENQTGTGATPPPR